MKVTLVVLALIGFGFSAPQPKKLFHEHFEEFLDIIMVEASDELDQILTEYMKFDEFVAAMNYVKTTNFKDVMYEMEHLPEFIAVVDFLENDNIDIHYFLDLFNDMLGVEDRRRRSARIDISGSDFASFMDDSIAAFPKDKLSALFDQKMAEDEEFRTAVENLQSKEWDDVLGALWDNDVFKAEIQSMAENGVDFNAYIRQIVAIFGQN